MRNTDPITDPKDIRFGSQLHLKLKRTRTGPRLKIRQLLRSFEPLHKPAKTAAKE